MTLERCVTGKVMYTRGHAHKVARFWRQRVYECPVCHRWHLTKQDR